MAKQTGVPTRQDVADKAKVAPSTVSLVLNNTPGARISQATRDRVAKAAKALGYNPNPVARALAMGKNDNIGIVLHFVDNPFNSFVASIMDGFWQTVQNEQEYRCLLGQGRPQKGLGGLYKANNVDAIAVLVPPLDLDDDELELAVASKFPVICIGSQPRNHQFDYVDIDNEKVGYEATKRLIEAGHRSIVHIAGPIDLHSGALERMQGYQRAIKEAKLKEPIAPIDCGFTPHKAYEETQKLLKSKVNFTAIFASNHAMAHSCGMALEEGGLSVPKDVSLIAVDRRTSPQFNITTAVLPVKEFGIEAGRRLLERMDNPRLRAKRILLPYTWDEGSSITAPA